MDIEKKIAEKDKYREIQKQKILKELLKLEIINNFTESPNTFSVAKEMIDDKLDTISEQMLEYSLISKNLDEATDYLIPALCLNDDLEFKDRFELYSQYICFSDGNVCRIQRNSLDIKVNDMVKGIYEKAFYECKKIVKDNKYNEEKQ